jgi:hypothetical protein
MFTLKNPAGFPKRTESGQIFVLELLPLQLHHTSKRQNMTKIHPSSSTAWLLSAARSFCQSLPPWTEILSAFASGDQQHRAGGSFLC